MNKVLDIENLTFAYEEKKILENFSCSIEQGNFVAIVGENGAGKSTLLNLILHNLKPLSGKIKIFGDDIDQKNHYQDIAYVSQSSVQNYRNFPTTVIEVIYNHLKFLKVKVPPEKYLDLVGLTEHQNKVLSELSGGQLQRVALAAAMIKNASLILLDEPTTGIDKKFSREFFGFLQEIASSGKTIVIVTHALDDAIDFIDYAIEIRNASGHILSRSDLQQLVVK